MAHAYSKEKDRESLNALGTYLLYNQDCIPRVRGEIFLDMSHI